METLEAKLDREVIAYLSKVEDIREVKDLLSGEISKDDYVRFLKTFYALEYISQKAVNLASEMTKEENPYLSKRLDVCAKGELGHAAIALEDLDGLGVGEVDLSEISIATEYEGFLQECAHEFPLGILGHSYLFENTSGVMFPKHNPLNFPSKFVEVHAKEDPGHSLAIRRTIRNVENDLNEDEQERILAFTNKSGEYLLKLFDSIKN